MRSYAISSNTAILSQVKQKKNSFEFNRSFFIEILRFITPRVLKNYWCLKVIVLTFMPYAF